MKRLRETKLRERERQAIEAAAAVLRQRLPMEQIILFGSKARGEDDPESDIDLLILTQRPLTRAEARLVVDLLYPLQLEYDIVFSALPVPASEWFHGVYQAMPPCAEVERDGVAA